MSFELKKHPRFPGRPGPVILAVLDGVGIGARDEADAVFLARTPNLDELLTQHPHLKLRAHGTAVGLPTDQDMGNSEVGHNALGAGRVYDQGAKLVDGAIREGTLFSGEVWQRLLARVRERNSALHFIGLLSDGNVHSHIDQLYALLRRAHSEGATRQFVHPLLDGRDVPPTSALTYLDKTEAVLAEVGGKIASGGGRMVTTMDRYEADWRIVERGWNAHVHGTGRPFPSARVAVETFRSETPGIGDQFLPPFVIVDPAGQPVGRIHDGDAVIFFNFRGDRAIEISRAFEEGPEFDKFDRGRIPEVSYAGLMQYDGDYHIPKQYLVTPPAIQRTMGEYLVRNRVSQLAISETQKYGHVTYFWNGNRGGMFDPALETYIEIPSDQVPFEERPWMKAAEITDRLMAEAPRYRFSRVNYANGDMVGHSGNRDAAILAVEAVDIHLGRLMKMIKRDSGILVVTADHGNADEMYEHEGGRIKRAPDGAPVIKTSHTLNPVPFTIYDPLRREGEYHLEGDRAGIANVTATCLNLLGFQEPDDEVRSLMRFP
jgi:2,3-bisphosphoglycerate-independent phosphoglycerate mutase